MVAPLSIKEFATLMEKARVMEKMKNEVEGQRPQQPQRIGGHLCPSPDMKSGGDYTTDLTISLRGLGTFLLSRVRCSVIYVEVPT